MNLSAKIWTGRVLTGLFALFMLGADQPSNPVRPGTAAGFNMVPWSHGAPGAAGLGRGGGGGDD